MSIVLFILGLFIGSFLLLLADRLPRGEDVLYGRSHCETCRKNLRWNELIPVLSFVLQRGRCLRCGTSLSFKYPLIEVCTGLGFAICAMHAQNTYELISLLIIFSSFLVIFLTDLSHQIIPDSMLVVLLTGIAIGVFPQVSGDLAINRIGAACIAGVLFYGLWAGTHGRGMGFGDVKLAPILGLWLGFPHIIVALYSAFLTGALAGVILIVGKQKKLKSKIAFGPFLIGGALIASAWGDPILRWWSGFL